MLLPLLPFGGVVTALFGDVGLVVVLAAALVVLVGVVIHGVQSGANRLPPGHALDSFPCEIRPSDGSDRRRLGRAYFDRGDFVWHGRRRSIRFAADTVIDHGGPPRGPAGSFVFTVKGPEASYEVDIPAHESYKLERRAQAPGR